MTKEISNSNLFAISFILSLAYLLGFEPFGFQIVGLLSISGLLFAALNTDEKKASLIFFLFGLFVYSIGLYWLYISIHIISGAPKILAVLLIILLASYLSLYHAIFGYTLIKIHKKIKNEIITLLLIAPPLWTLLEIIRGHFLTGFPWLSLGYMQSGNLISSWAPIGGVYLVSLIMLLVASSFLLIRKRRVLSVSIIIFVIVFSYGLGTYDWTKKIIQLPSKVALVQGNIDQESKWLRSEFEGTLAHYESSLNELENIDLVIWPEVAIPALKRNVEEYLLRLKISLSANNIKMLIMGVNTQDSLGQIYNSMITVGDEDHIYHKRHLVPFGEYFPVSDGIRSLMKSMRLPSSDMTEGEKNQSLIYLNEFKIAPSICYEDIFGSDLLDFMPTANVIINITNNAWFGQSIASAQHFQMSRMRAVETGRYLLRSTNTGITAVVDPKGRVQSSAEPYKYSVLVEDFFLMEGKTPYMLWGDSFSFIFNIFLMTIGLIIGMLRFKNRNDRFKI